MAQEILEEKGAVVQIAGNGIEALDMLRQRHFDCVLMDMQMPVMDGLEATRRIRAEPKLADTLVIAMTANASTEDQTACLRAGMNGFITKPISPSQLYATIVSFLRKPEVVAQEAPIRTETPRRRATDRMNAADIEAAAISTTSTTSATDATPRPEPGLVGDPEVIDLSILAKNVSSKPADVRKFALKFLESARQGLEEIDGALTRQDLATACAVGHRIKAPARTVGAMKFADLCLSLEQQKNNGSIEQAGECARQLHTLLGTIRADLDRRFSTDNGDNSGTATGLASPLRVMMLDDEPFHLEFVTNKLRKLGILDIVHATDGVHGLEIFQASREKPHILICDLEMPKMDGVEFLRNVATQGYHGGVILLSGADASVLKTVGQLTNAHGIRLLGAFKKPVNLDALAATITRFQVAPKESAAKSPSIKVLSIDELREALANDRVEAFFQPKVSIATRQVLGAECLARLRHPQHGIVNPVAFIGVAEEHGLIDDLTQQMVRKCAEQQGKWLRAGHNFSLSVNISMDNLSRLDLPEIFDRIVRTAGAEPGSMILELTESRLIENQAIALDIIARLRLKGFGLSIDDFGTGFSTMESLHKLPFTELKVDRSFVRGATRDEKSYAILMSSIRLGKTFNLGIVAEGVETQADWDTVARAGCDVVQGYFAGKPMPADDFVEWQSEWATRSR